MRAQKRTHWLVGVVIGTALAAMTGVAGSQPMNPLSVEPRLPRLAQTPCVVELFRDVRIDNSSDAGLFREFEYTPPANCPGPWAKIILSVDLTGPGTTDVINITISLADQRRNVDWATELFVGGAQFNAGQGRWRVERDVTDYSALMRTARPGYLMQTDGYFRDACGCVSGHATARLIFYPVVAAQAAPAVPDAVYPAHDHGAFVFSPALPRNIERAYLDVYAQQPQPWFSCVPPSAALDFPLLVSTPLALGDYADPGLGDPQGCAGTGYRDVVVLLDGQPAGVAPVYPWLNSDLNLHFERTVDVPVPTPQSINLLPFRVDLTPFAGILSNGADHAISFQFADGETLMGGPFVRGQLLLYLDHGSTQVSGQVTRNSLVGTNVQQTYLRNQWQAQADMVTGDVLREFRRSFQIAGYVNTSRGRINTTVTQDQLLTSAQLIRLVGITSLPNHTYAQNLDMDSATNRTILRELGGTVLALDRERFHYPLRIDWEATGGTTATAGSRLDHGSAFVEQGHHNQSSYYRPAGSYATRLYANFAGGRVFDGQGGYTRWQGARSHYFYDNMGSCFRERVTWVRDAVTSHTQGVGCPGDANRIRGFAHPDGSPDSMGWWR